MIESSRAHTWRTDCIAETKQEVTTLSGVSSSTDPPPIQNATVQIIGAYEVPFAYSTVPGPAITSVVPEEHVRIVNTVPTTDVLPVAHVNNPSNIIGVKRDRSETDNQSFLITCFEDAWKLITTPSFAIDSNSLAIVLGELGLTEKEMLEYCEQEEMQTIANELKVLPARKLMELFRRWKQFSI